MKETTKYIILLLCTIFTNHILTGQTYLDHFGTGNDVGVTVSSSNNQGTESGVNLLNGTDLLPDLVGAARFLGQASLGANYEDIEYVSQIGIEAWIDEQMAMPASLYPSYLSSYNEFYDSIIIRLDTLTATNTRKRTEYFPFVFYQKTLTEEDVLREKIAFALSQIFVISRNDNSLTNIYGDLVASYYDILYKNAFGNFQDILNEVTRSTAMSIYLSYYKNKKAQNGAEPDENYAREIMQLFTVGLWELNNDGSLKLDTEGEPIPTYNNFHIKELAKVFTGLSGGAAFQTDLGCNTSINTCNFDFSSTCYDLTVPLQMCNNQHSSGTKELLDGTIIPSGQDGLQDIQDAINVLFNHSNVGPFISKRLIQQLVKSNPSPAYINRVATVFKNNGNGTRGDMKAVIRAILIDPEARNCDWINNTTTGKLLQPMERVLNLFLAFDINTPSGDFWYLDDRNGIYEDIEQAFIFSPTVFNFFTPFYAEPDNVKPVGMVSPEFQILNTHTVIAYANRIEQIIKEKLFINYTESSNVYGIAKDDNNEPYLDLSTEIDIYDDDGLMPLIEHLNMLLARGQLSNTSKTIIENVITNYIIENPTYFTTEKIVKEAIFFIMISPEYLILK